jgi:hypothetical protein
MVLMKSILLVSILITYCYGQQWDFHLSEDQIHRINKFFLLENDSLLLVQVGGFGYKVGISEITRINYYKNRKVENFQKFDDYIIPDKIDDTRGLGCWYSNLSCCMPITLFHFGREASSHPTKSYYIGDMSLEDKKLVIESLLERYANKKNEFY